jgi:hypothetical protein
MTQPPTILIGVSKKKMNRLLHSKNEIYYYVINDSIRKVLCTLFDALGNISSRNDYYSFIKKYVQFKPFSTCKSAISLKHPLTPKQCILIAIDNITRELYLPTENEFNSVSLHINYPTLIPQHKNDFIKEIFEEHYKEQLQHVLYELVHKSSMKPVLNDIKKRNVEVHYKEQLKNVLHELVHKSSMKPVLNDIKKRNIPKVELEIEGEDYEDDFEIEFEEKTVYPTENEKKISSEYEYILPEESTLETIGEELDESLESVVDELKEVMILAKQLLPNAKPLYYPPTIVIDEETDDMSVSASFCEKHEETDDMSVSASFCEKHEETHDMSVSAPFIVKDDDEENFIVQKVAFPSPCKHLEGILEKSLPSTVEFIEVKETEPEVEVPNVFLAEDIQKVINSEEVLEEAEDDVEEISKEEFEQEEKQDEQLKTSTLVNELFQKYQKDTKPEEEVKKPEPPKSYLSSMWSYLGWKSK